MRPLAPPRAACLAALLALFAALPLGAETVRIRTGEHDGFSRLVLTFSAPETGWSFGRMEDGYQLRLDRHDVDFDLSQVFDKIPKSRLAAISADDARGRLTLRLGCPCHAEIFPFRDNILVIDIRSGPAARNSPFERPLPADPPPPKLPIPQKAPVYDWRKVEIPALPPPPPPKVTTPAAPDPEVARAREALLRQLARAGAQGLIDADPRKLGLDTPAGETAHPRPADQGKEPESHTEKPAAGIRARTAVDRDAPETTAPGLSATGGACPSDNSLAIGDWGDDTPPGDQIGTDRRALLGEFDHPRPGAVAALARLYLFLGFGAEARTVLAAFPDEGGKARPTLLALGAILDDERPDLSRPLAGLAACNGAVALWSMLATPAPERTDVVAAGAVVRTFSGLPMHLRSLLGPRLAEAFLARSDTETTRALRDAIARAPNAPGDRVDVMSAKLDMAEGHLAKAQQALAPVIADDGPLSPEALALSIDARVGRGEAIDTATLSAVEALAREYRNTPLGAPLARAHALALASLDRFTEAFAGLPPGSPPGAPKIWALLATKGSDEQLVRNAIPPPKRPPDAATRLKIAARLTSLGFGQAAEAWIGTGTDPGTAERLGLARAALALRDGQGALRQLAGLDTPDATLLRARAYALIGDHATAARLYASLGATDLEGAQAWRAGDWAEAEAKGTRAQKEALDLLKPPHPAPRNEGPLARDRALVSSSEEARRVLETLLGQTADAAPQKPGADDP